MLIPPPSKSEDDYGDDETEESDGTDEGITQVMIILFRLQPRLNFKF